MQNSWSNIENENSQINCRKPIRYKLLATDKMSFYLDEEGKHQAKDQIAKLKDKAFVLSSINQSFSIFHNNYLTASSKTPITTSYTSKTDHSKKDFKSFRFKLIQMPIFFIMLLASINCVVTNENSLSNSLKKIESQTTNPLGNSISSVTVLTNLSLGSTVTKSINSSTSSSLSFMRNLLPSTKTFNYFYLNNQLESDQLTTRLPIINKNFNSSKLSNIDNSIKNNQEKSARFYKNAFQINFNQQFNPELSDLKIIVGSEKWPYGSKLKNFNWTDRYKKETENSNWSYSASTEAAEFKNNYSSSDFLSSDYDSNFSKLINSIPTPSALINQIPNKTSSFVNNTTIYNKKSKGLESKTINKTNFVENFNLTDADSNFISDFLQPFTNISWWNKIPFPQSGYHNYSIVFLAFFITIVMMVVVIGNLLVCIAICTEKSLKTIQNWFIASLAVSDLLLGLIIMPFSLAYELMGTWVFSDLW
ncbi:7 transmembrane receptor [Candidatus Phytoplasma fabacearum]|uniref:7 transmembrane receptor n=1 Tax=Candidatus Phytoplasma fabacearum TaxID=2982628 RepID=UPI002713C303|nr:7 transmembrane receptor ['Bituminaria bituminosa' little leaf phytoplasma]MDO8030670.1 7 transmembrane receptor ['Bituminaria bituminosa' little leaf phytoplasma]